MLWCDVCESGSLRIKLNWVRLREYVVCVCVHACVSSFLKKMVLLCTLLIIVPPPRLAACLRCVFFRYWSFRISNSPYCCTAAWCSVRTLLNSSSTIPCAKKLAVMIRSLHFPSLLTYISRFFLFLAPLFDDIRTYARVTNMCCELFSDC